MSYQITSVSIRIGFDATDLPTAGHIHERKPVFKEYASTHFAAVFGTLPADWFDYAGNGLEAYFNAATGYLADDDVREWLDAQVSGADRAAADATRMSCLWDAGGSWKKARTFPLTTASTGDPWTAAPIRTAYAAGEGITLSAEAIAALDALPIVAEVWWTVGPTLAATSAKRAKRGEFAGDGTRPTA